MVALIEQYDTEIFKPFRKILLVTVCVSALALSACSENRKVGETVGTVAGSILGALIGSQFGSGAGKAIAVAVGAAAGAIIGGTLGAELDDEDRFQAQVAATEALNDAEEGESVSWANPESGNEGSYTPTESFETSEGLRCREFTQTIAVGGEEEDTVGTACKQPDGSWQIVG